MRCGRVRRIFVNHLCVVTWRKMVVAPKVHGAHYLGEAVFVVTPRHLAARIVPGTVIGSVRWALASLCFALALRSCFVVWVALLIGIRRYRLSRSVEMR